MESVLNSCKNLKWFCNSCIEIYNNVFEKLNLIQDEIIDEIQFARNHKKSQLDSFHIKFIEEMSYQAEIIESAKIEILNKNVVERSYADALKNKEAVMIVKPKNKKQKNDKTKK
jgi:hypothetical protein